MITNVRLWRVLFVSLLVLVSVILTKHFTAECPTSAHKTSAQRGYQDINWDDLFSFVPPSLYKCVKLFENDTAFPEEFTKKFNKYKDTLAAHLGGREVEGYAAMYPETFKAYLTIAQAPFIKTVCETGFNGGHSTFGWLTINPNTHVYSFDIGEHSYSKKMAEHLQELYPGRLNVTWGDSMVTLPKFRQDHPEVKCDLMIIDGGHHTPIAQSDFDNFRLMANEANLVILDDYPARFGANYLALVWEHAKRLGIITDIFHCLYLEHERKNYGISVGRFLF